MSNEVKVSQEMYNRLLDTINKVETLQKSIRETREHLRANQLKVKELELKIDENKVKIMKLNNDLSFQTIFRENK